MSGPEPPFRPRLHRRRQHLRHRLAGRVGSPQGVVRLRRGRRHRGLRAGGHGLAARLADRLGAAPHARVAHRVLTRSSRRAPATSCTPSRACAGRGWTAPSRATRGSATAASCGSRSAARRAAARHAAAGRRDGGDRVGHARDQLRRSSASSAGRARRASTCRRRSSTRRRARRFPRRTPPWRPPPRWCCRRSSRPPPP